MPSCPPLRGLQNLLRPTSIRMARHYDANGYPELTACLDRRPKPALAEAA